MSHIQFHKFTPSLNDRFHGKLPFFPCVLALFPPFKLKNFFVNAPTIRTRLRVIILLLVALLSR